MIQERMAQLGASFWLVARDGDHPVEVFTMGCGGAKSLLVFSHEEEAEMFLDLGGTGNGWRMRESSAGEVVSLLFGLCSRVSSVALDPSPLMTPEMLDLVRVDRGRFVDLITAPGEKKPLPRSRWVLTPGRHIRWNRKGTFSGGDASTSISSISQIVESSRGYSPNDPR